jgi:hypothetical protein
VAEKPRVVWDRQERLHARPENRHALNEQAEALCRELGPRQDCEVLTDGIDQLLDLSLAE